MAARKVIRVHFMDESFRAFGIDPNATAEQLRATVIERIELKEDSCFAVFEKKGEVERCLEADDKPAEMMKVWEMEAKTKPKDKDQPGDPIFLFKKKIFLKDDEKELSDMVARNLVYIQALRNVNDGTYPCTPENAVLLGGLQVQAVYGDHNPATHVVGFLAQNLKNFVPQPLWGLKRPPEWEQAILKEHSRHKGKSHDDAKLDYLNICKLWTNYYGTTFFPACKTQQASKNLPKSVVIGVNYEGIRLYKPKNKEPLEDHLFTQICSWASSSSTFAFEFGNQTESVKYSFETKQGAIIAASIQTYIDILVQMLKNGEDDEEESQTGTSEEDGDD